MSQETIISFYRHNKIQISFDVKSIMNNRIMKLYNKLEIQTCINDLSVCLEYEFPRF